ncbi:MAG: ABC transporter permease subunit, partial [Algiphilus sp.]
MARELPIGEYVSDGVDFLLDHAQGLFDGIAAGIEFVSGNLTDLLQATPIWAVFAVLAGLGLWRVGWRFALFVLVALYVILGMDLWEQTMDTLGLVLAATLVALGIGLPSGVAMAKSDIVAAVVRPVLDFMQTLPAFVYLIPAVLFFGLGEVPGTIATVIFSMPPAVRLMNLGIRHVPVENVEAGRAFGCNGAQLLFKVE